jgi:hypothetical protein
MNLYKKLLHKCEFCQAHCVDLCSLGFIQNLFCHFWTFLLVFMNFGSLKQFLEFI